MDSVSCYCTNARRAARALTSLYDDAMAQHGLKVTQFSLLRAVERHGEPNFTELATATGLDRSTLGRNLRLLEQLGLLALSPGEDQRDRRADLTQEGQARIRAAARAWSAVQDRVGEVLGKDAQRFVELARRLTDLVGGGAQRRRSAEPGFASSLPERSSGSSPTGSSARSRSSSSA